MTRGDFSKDTEESEKTWAVRVVIVPQHKAIYSLAFWLSYHDQISDYSASSAHVLRVPSQLSSSLIFKNSLTSEKYLRKATV